MRLASGEMWRQLQWLGCYDSAGWRGGGEGDDGSGEGFG
jgi:hypothetical protein